MPNGLWGGGLRLKHNYRFVFIPETIGSIVYISRNLKSLKENVKAGFVLSCVGDELGYSLIHSPSGDNLAEKVALHILKDKQNFKEYDFSFGGSDERQYCSPLVNLAVCGICRTKYGEFKGYHNSKDDLNFITQKGLNDSLEVMKEIIKTLEINDIYISNVYCEPNLGKRGLYPTLSTTNQDKSAYYYRKFLAFCDGKRDIMQIADILNVKAYELKGVVKALLENDLIKRVKDEI